MTQTSLSVKLVDFEILHRAPEEQAFNICTTPITSPTWRWVVVDHPRASIGVRLDDVRRARRLLLLFLAHCVPPSEDLGVIGARVHALDEWVSKFSATSVLVRPVRIPREQDIVLTPCIAANARSIMNKADIGN